MLTGYVIDLHAFVEQSYAWKLQGSMWQVASWVFGFGSQMRLLVELASFRHGG